MLKTVPELIADAAANVRTTDADTARREIDVNHGVLVDLREPQEVAAAPTAAHHRIPRGVLEMHLPAVCPDPAQPIYLHCAVGARAQLAAAQLAQLGYQNVTALACSAADVSDAFGPGEP